ncbi:hypothetical protein EMIHUDRAFT_200249 [Emiliania huxleyi CCMP1516]|uniref:ubiquitinyl hydrolase 1 n=2 Tax=Emiliania huxleyi TaxID=2903 RepID=A0A0D3KV84_EMIH1|nr:hypothetical protein EMIHUDRAFT_200249 [Emiliania huxleyi CCMP1516]EOD39669.1 hypothetical protein EMIHUDRAFT_200249 [Emiliania huxleyi CCMP1516]|eukprot:XP_005792098.1 hypothetical protein EMIHUDRAFT_200249 [Emiliania huxleyi CCMP1516]
MGAKPHAIAGSSLAASASVDGYNSADEHEVAVSAPAETIEAFAARMAATRGLQLVPMLRDGNCLFRAVADRVYGDHAMHDVVRQQTLDHVAAESAHFSPYVAEDIHTYVARKRRDGVYGNHVELQALSELYNRRVEVYAPNGALHSNCTSGSTNTALGLFGDPDASVPRERGVLVVSWLCLV